MKSLLTIVTLLTLTTVAFAHPPKRTFKGKKQFAKVVIKGKKAKALFESLDADIVTKDRKHFTADIKKVATLRCAQLTKKADTSVVKYRCAMLGKKKKKNGPGHGRRRGPRRTVVIIK